MDLVESGGWIAGGACVLFALRTMVFARRERVPGSHYLALAFVALGVAVVLGATGEVRSAGAPPADAVVDRLVSPAGAAYAAFLVALLAMVWVVAHGAGLRSLWINGGDLGPSMVRLRMRIAAMGLLVLACVSPLVFASGPDLAIAAELVVVLAVAAVWVGALPPARMLSLHAPTAEVRAFESAVVRTTDPRSLMNRLSNLVGRITGASEVWLLRDGAVEVAYGLDALEAATLSARLPTTEGGPQRVQLDERSWLLSVPFGSGRMVMRTGVFTPLISARTDDIVQRLAGLAALAADRDRARLLERQMRDRIDGLASVRDEFLSGVSHELRTPLTVIRGVAELLHREPEQMRRMQTDLLALLADNVQDLTDILGSFERLASLRGGQQLQVVTRFPLRAAIDAGLLLVEDGCPGRNFEVDVTDVVMCQDQAAVVRVIVELLTNAAQHSGSADPIEVTASAAGDDAVVEITDRGRGMTADELARATEPFFRTDDAMTRGAGVGLTIVEELADQLSGSFELRSEVGTGTSARLRIPQSHPGSVELGMAPGVTSRTT